MRLKPSNSAFLIVCFTLLSAIAVNGQEDKGQGQSDEPIVKDVKENLRNDPDPSLVESESRTSKPSIIPSTKETLRDSSAVHVKAPKPLKANEKVPKEEDPLSFNFLYYIIEKFKLSDIIE